MKRNIMILLGLSAVLVTAACGASEIIDPTRVPTQAGQSEPTQPSTPTKQSEPTQAPDASGQGDTSSGGMPPSTSWPRPCIQPAP